MREIDFSSPYWSGALPTRLVRRLSGASPGQLRSWHRRGAVAASISPGGRGHPRLYGWIDYCKARAAVKLLDRGVARSQLPEELRRLDTDITDWVLAPLSAYRDHLFAPNAAGDGYILCEPPQADGRRVGESAPPYAVDQRAVDREDAGCARLLSVAQELQAEGSLGLLCRFGEFIHIHPGIFGGGPVLIGTRLETALLSTMYTGAGEGAAWIAEMYEIAVERVEAAVEFEKALAA